jgi:hypothetical protein
MLQSNTPLVGTLFEIAPSTASAIFGFELEAQRPRIMVGNKLQRARVVEMLEELQDYCVANARIDVANIDQTISFADIGHIHQMPQRY